MVTVRFYFLLLLGFAILDLPSKQSKREPLCLTGIEVTAPGYLVDLTRLQLFFKSSKSKNRTSTFSVESKQNINQQHNVVSIFVQH